MAENGKGEIVATYDYRNAAGQLVYQSCRVEPGPDGKSKTFFQRRPTGPGQWVNNMAGVKPVLYRLPELLAADPGEMVYIVEGEKDADNLAAAGCVVVTNVSGAGKWRPEYSEVLRGRRVTILPDNDQAGLKHAQQVLSSLHNIAEEPLIIELPGLPAKGDVSDWLEANRGRAVDGNVKRLLLETITEVKRTQQTQAAPRFRFERITLRQLLDSNFQEEYLIEDVLVAKQPLIIGAPKKALKTTLMIEMAICLASGLPFLGKWKVNRPIRVGIMSGESGRATIQETAARIVKAKGWDVPIDDLVRLCFRVPRFGETSHVEALKEFITEDGLEMLSVDPTYLAIPATENASNIFAVGSLLGTVTEIGESSGCTMALLHHLRKNLVDPFVPPELEDLAWSAFAEWARQWILLGRRVRFDPDGNGEHKLWMNVGGSAGHCSLWALDVEEGRKTDPGGRHWTVELNRASEARSSATQEQRSKTQEEKAQKEAATLTVNENKILAALRQFPDGGTETDIRERAGLSGTKFGPAIGSLLDQGKVMRFKVPKANKQRYDGFKIRPDDGQEEMFS
jgi:hypothetical protein